MISKQIWARNFRSINNPDEIRNCSIDKRVSRLKNVWQLTRNKNTNNTNNTNNRDITGELGHDRKSQNENLLHSLRKSVPGA